MNHQDVNCTSTQGFDPLSCSILHSQPVVPAECPVLPSSTGIVLSVNAEELSCVHDNTCCSCNSHLRKMPVAF